MTTQQVLEAIHAIRREINVLEQQVRSVSDQKLSSDSPNLKTRKKRARKVYDGPERPERLPLPENPTQEDYAAQIAKSNETIAFWQTHIDSGELSAHNAKLAGKYIANSQHWIGKMTAALSDSSKLESASDKSELAPESWAEM